VITNWGHKDGNLQPFLIWQCWF